MEYTAEDFLRKIAENPEEKTTLAAYADWLEEHGHTVTAAHVRSFRRPILDITVESLQDDYDWGEVFGEGSGGNCDKSKIDACPPGAEIDLSPPFRKDVVEVIAAVNGEGDGASWVGVFRLADGRILLADAWCDYTGWD